MTIDNAKTETETSLKKIIEEKYDGVWDCSITNWSMKYIEEGEYYYILDDMSIDESIEEKPSYKYEPMLWKVVLRTNPNSDYFENNLNEYQLQRDKKKKGKDRGHFIANAFKKYLFTDDNIKKKRKQIDLFFSKGNKRNITPQDRKSNRNSKKYTGQLKFEQKIQTYFENKKNIDKKVYYEIEEIKTNGKILGRRIFIHWYDEKNDDEHVFIPEER